MYPTTIPNAYRNPLEVERLLSENSLRRSLAADRRVSVEKHAEFQRSLTTHGDDDIDDLVEIDPYVSGTSNRRSDKELSKILDLIDNLPISTNGKDGRH
jgi:hypothetical protein